MSLQRNIMLTEGKALKLIIAPIAGVYEAIKAGWIKLLKNRWSNERLNPIGQSKLQQS